MREVADRLIDSRRLSVVVVDEDDRPLGRILADDVLDAVIRGHRRWQFPRAPVALILAARARTAGMTRAHRPRR